VVPDECIVAVSAGSCNFFGAYAHADWIYKTIPSALRGYIMAEQPLIVNISGLAIVFFYCLYRFNSPPPAKPEIAQDGSRVAATLRQWFQMRPPPTPSILPPPRANTTAFKFWLYRSVYAVIGVGIYLLVIQVPGLREPIPGIMKLFQLPDLPKLDLTNGVVLAILLIALARMPPLRGADTLIRRALYERASIPAHQLGFQFLLRGAVYLPDDKMLKSIREDLLGDGFAEADIEYDRQATTRSLWTKINLLMRQLEIWGQKDQYKTAFAILREQGSEKLAVDRVREACQALKGDARTYLAALRQQPNEEGTWRRKELFRQECKSLLDAIYALVTRVMLRSHFSYYDAIAAVKRAGFDIQANATPLPNKNDLVALILIFFLVVTIPLSYALGFYRATMITFIYVLATLTPIYLAAEWPNLLRRDDRRMPPLAFPIVSALLAGGIGFLVALFIGSMQTAEATLWQFSVSQGLQRWRTISYPWTLLVCGLTGALSVLMLIGRYPDVSRLQGVRRYRQWICPLDGLMLGGFTLALMILLVFPMLVRLVPQYYTWEEPLVLIRPVITAFVIGLVVPTWYRGNRELIHKHWRHAAEVERG